MKKQIIGRLRSLGQLKRAVAMVWRSGPRWMIASLFFVLVQAVLPLLSLLLLKAVVDSVTAGLQVPVGSPARQDAWQNTLFWIGLAALVALLSALASTAAGYVTQGQGLAVQQYMGRLVQRKAAQMDLEYFENAEFFNTLHRAQEEAPFRPTQIVNNLTQMAQNVIGLAALVGLLLTLHPLVPFILLIAVVPGLLVRLRFTGVLFRWTQQSTPIERKAQYLNYVLTLEPFAKEVRLFEMSDFFGRRFDAMRTWLTQGRLRMARRRLLADVGVQFFVVAPTFGLLAFTAYQTFEGIITLGAMVMYLQTVQRAQAAMQGALGSLLSLHENATFLSVLYQFLDLQPRMQPPIQPRALPAAWQEGIRVENVSFGYSGSEREALTDISLDIAPGEVVALVGENGSGKTTLVKLLCRLYDPVKGRITLDGTDLRDFDPTELRRQISVVFQDYRQYSLTLNENIWLGNLQLPANHAGLESGPSAQAKIAILEAARQSGADGIAARLPQGYDTLLGRGFEDGEELSIGQWQKVALARAFLRSSQLIILDEPTSALDPRAEAEVFDKFRSLIRGQSALLISHRLSTVRMADRICVLDKGKIVAMGTHDELVESGGLYAQLFQTQAHAYR
ncbi:MAG TPA: ABC transporter ATP-binding protein [Abditibacterium sp.]